MIINFIQHYLRILNLTPFDSVLIISSLIFSLMNKINNEFPCNADMYFHETKVEIF